MKRLFSKSSIKSTQSPQEDSYVSGFKLNYNTDSDSSSHNSSTLLSIQQLDNLTSSSTSKLLAKSNNNNENISVQNQSGELVKKLNNDIQSAENSKISLVSLYKKKFLNDKNYKKYKATQKFDKNSINSDNDFKNNLRNVDGFTDSEKRSIAERCRISIECKNSQICLEGHAVNNNTE